MILDTNALSALAEGDRGPALHLASSDVLALPVIVMGEWQYGIRRSRNRAKYESWLSLLVSRIRILVVDAETASCYAEVREGLRVKATPIPENDIWIAALAIQHAMPILTKDAHFAAVSGLTRIGW